ncbi:MAG: hypothetical protein ACP5KS_06300 [Candidatus Hydrogenedens sp.]
MNSFYIQKTIIFLGFTLFLFFSSTAYVLDIEAENTFVKITKAFDPDTDPDLVDVDKNGISDRAHARLLDRVLRDETVPNHDLLLSIYYFNWVQIKKDNTLGSKCIAIQQLYGITCDEIERFSAAIITMGEPVAIQYFVQGAISQVGINIDLKNYNLSGGLYLRATADLDGDLISNRKEFLLAEGDFDLFVQYAVTPQENPNEGEIEIPPIDKDVPLIITPAVNSMLNFGSISLKNSVVGEFTVQNIGTEDIPFYIWIIGEPEFQIIGERTFLVEPQGIVKFQVKFTPRDFNKVSGILVIEVYGEKYYIYMGGQGSWLRNVISCNIDSQQRSESINKGDISILLLTLLLLGFSYKKQRKTTT